MRKCLVDYVADALFYRSINYLWPIKCIQLSIFCNDKKKEKENFRSYFILRNIIHRPMNNT